MDSKLHKDKYIYKNFQISLRMMNNKGTTPACNKIYYKSTVIKISDMYKFYNYIWAKVVSCLHTLDTHRSSTMAIFA